MQCFKKQYPGIELQVREAKSDELLQAVMRDDISFYIIPRDQAELPVRLKVERIYRERLILVAAQDTISSDMLDGQESPETEAGSESAVLKPLPCVNLNRM